MSGVLLDQRILVDDDSAAGTKAAIRLNDFKNQSSVKRLIVGSMNALDTIIIQGSIDGTTYADIESFTGSSSFWHLLEGHWSYVRAVKVGIVGAATIKIVG